MGYYDPSGYIKEKLPSDYRAVWAVNESDEAIKAALEGTQTGQRGNSFAVLRGVDEKDKKVNEFLAEHGKRGVWYREVQGKCRPDFDPFSMFDVNLDNMTNDRTGDNGNYNQTKEKIAQAILENNGDITRLQNAGIVNSKVTDKTLGEVNDFLENKARPILDLQVTDEEKLSRLKTEVSKLEKSKDSYGKKIKTIHEAYNPKAQLIPYKVNSSFPHDGGVSDQGGKHKNTGITESCLQNK